jgi:phage-related protein
MTAEQFATQWSQEGGAAKNFMGFMEQLHLEGQGAILTLEDLDADTIRVIRTMLSAAGGYETLEKAMGFANSAWEENTALAREAEIRYNTFSSQLEIVKNKFRDLSFTIGQELIPIFQPLLDNVVQPFIEGLEKGLPGAMETVGEAIRTQFIPALEGLAESFGLTDPDSVAEGVERIGEKIAEHIDNISEFVGKFEDFTELYRSGDLQGAFEALGIEEKNSENLADLAESLSNIVGSIKNISEKDVGLWKAIVESFAEIGGFVDAFAQLLQFSTQPVHVQTYQVLCNIHHHFQNLPIVAVLVVQLVPVVFFAV